MAPTEIVSIKARFSRVASDSLVSMCNRYYRKLQVNNCTSGFARKDVSFHGLAGLLMLKIRNCFLFVIPVQADMSVIP